MDKSFPLFQGSANDANVTIRFSEDNLGVWGDFYPPTGNGKPLNPRQITGALSNQNVTFGVLFENIQNAVRDCNLNRAVLKDVPLARGNPSVDEVLEYFEFNSKIGKLVPEKPKGNARIDYRSFSPFIIVKKGQALAYLRPRTEGKDGIDIHGSPIPHRTIRPEGVSPGENTYSDGKFIYAGISGQLIREKGLLRVQDHLEIKGGVDYHTGNIIFPGDVTINGPVSDGFKVFSGGSITIKQTFDITDVSAKANLNVLGGLVGRDRATVKVGGELRAKFIENCKVACRKTIKVDADIVNSSVYTLERIEMGEKGMILGGEAYAVQGIRASGIGKKSGKNTLIHCGIDFTARQERDKLKTYMGIINAKLGKVRRRLEAEKTAVPEPAPGSPEEEIRSKLEEALKVLEGEQKKTSQTLVTVLGRLNANESAAVEVSGTISPGTLIEICEVALFVTDPLQHVKIMLDKTANKLVSQPLS